MIRQVRNQKIITIDGANHSLNRAGHVTHKQKMRLIQFMAKHPELIKPRVTDEFNYKDSQQLWRTITEECNSMIGAKKTWRQWRKCWQDLRSSVKRKQDDGDVPTYVLNLTATEQEALGIKNVSSTTRPDSQESTEFVPIDTDNTHDSYDNDEIDNDSLSSPSSPAEQKLFQNIPLIDPDSPHNENIFTQSQKIEKNVKNKKERAHTEGCIFNCDMLTVQEQKKLQVKEDYHSFKKDYLNQKLLILKEQAEALKGIARGLASNKGTHIAEHSGGAEF